MPTLSVMLGVKDEELLLPRVLRSIRSVADEIVVVDTGSTDRTVEIAREYGARVLDGPRGERYVEAWNVGLEACRSDWVLNWTGTK